MSDQYQLGSNAVLLRAMAGFDITLRGKGSKYFDEGYTTREGQCGNRTSRTLL